MKNDIENIVSFSGEENFIPLQSQINNLHISGGYLPEEKNSSTLWQAGLYI